MKSTLKITIKPGEKLYLNGAVIRSDRKVSLELLNDVHFLMESHVLQAEDATSPLRQLYFIVQFILMSPSEADQARVLFRRSLPRLLDSFSDERIVTDLKHIDQLVAEEQVFEALKVLRALFPIEDAILNPMPTMSQHAPMMAAGE